MTSKKLGPPRPRAARASGSSKASLLGSAHTLPNKLNARTSQARGHQNFERRQPQRQSADEEAIAKARDTFGNKDGKWVTRPSLVGAFRRSETDEFTGTICIGIPGGGEYGGTTYERTVRFGGRIAGSAIKLDPLDGNQLIICENLETALRARRIAPAWCLGSNSALRNFPLIAGVQKLLVATGPSEPSIEAAEACCRRWQHDGRLVRHVIRPG